MNNDTVDLLQIKIEKAKRELPLETINAINAVDWRGAISKLQTKTKYNLEQLSDLELETELVLCGLVSPKDYPSELEKSMGISKAAVSELVDEMNNSVFKKIREKLIENTERKKTFQKTNTSMAEEKVNTVNDTHVLDSAGIKITESKETLPDLERLELIGGRPAENRESLLQKIEKPENIHTILSQKLSTPVQAPKVKTEYSLPNIQSSQPSQNGASPQNKVDPYREIPE